MDPIILPLRIETIIGSFLAGKKESTQINYTRALSLWHGFLHGDRASQPVNWNILLSASPGQAKEFLYQVLQDKQPSTAHLYKVVLKGLYAELMAYNACGSNPFAHPIVTLPRGSARAKNPIPWMTPEDCRALLGQLVCSAPIDCAIISLLLGGGLRRGEVLALTLDDVKETVLSGSGERLVCLRLRTTKNGQTYDQILPGWASQYVRIYKAEALKNNPDNRLIPLSRRGLDWHFKALLRAAGISSDYSPHSCRKAAITRLLDQGYSHREVMRFSRHSSVSMVEYYDSKRFTEANHPGAKLNYKDDNENI